MTKTMGQQWRAAPFCILHQSILRLRRHLGLQIILDTHFVDQ